MRHTTRHGTIVLLGWLSVTAPFAALLGEPDGPETEIERLERRLLGYKTGLERAVAELNRVQGPAGSASTPPRASPPPPRPVLETGRRLFSRPRTEVAGGRAVVRGEIRSYRAETLRGTLVVELLRDGMPVDEVRLPWEIPPFGVAAYSQAFELEGWAAGHYSARVGFNY